LEEKLEPKPVMDNGFGGKEYELGKNDNTASSACPASDNEI
jgi:hypothetical protein